MRQHKVNLVRFRRKGNLRGDVKFYFESEDIRGLRLAMS